jgi:hypothetical protein
MGNGLPGGPCDLPGESEDGGTAMSGRHEAMLLEDNQRLREIVEGHEREMRQTAEFLLELRKEDMKESIREELTALSDKLKARLERSCPTSS